MREARGKIFAYNRADAEEKQMIRPDRIGHVVLKVREIERSLKFYTEVMGFKLMRRQDNLAFLSSGRDHHEIAIMEIGMDAPDAKKEAVGLFHVAYRLRDEDHLRAAYKFLKQSGVPILGMTNHGVTKSIYINDPDGNPLEVYCDRVPELWNQPQQAVPLDIEAEERAAALAK